MGEALGLKWSDVDLAGGTLRVNRQLQRMRREEDAGKPGKLVFSEPKNASRRTVDLPLRALTALKRHRKRQLEEKLGGRLIRGLRARLRHRQGDAPRCAERRQPSFQASAQARGAARHTLA
jgi:integrase